jgi:limonene 1,2-monooxygenase
MLADRMNQLDHITRGRVMFGVGPGALPSDAHMMGIPVARQRDRMDEALACIVRLLRGETVTHKSDWFELCEAHLQMTPYTRPSIEMAVASQVSPTGANAAGRHGLGLLSIGATSAGGFNALASNWAIAEQSARDNGQSVDRANWRLVGPMHIAETREQARADVAFGLRKWLYYFTDVAALPMAVDADADPVDALVATGLAVVGTPDDAIAQIERLEKQSGGFGAYLSLDHNWADWPQKQRSYELLARHVFPRFQGSNLNRESSLGWARDNRPTFVAELFGAVGQRVAQHIQDKGGENIAPEIMAAMGLGKKPDAAE